MKISVVPLSPPPAGAARSSIAQGGPPLSFTELLEGGTSASTVSGGRALSFLETGLMGLHFAPDGGATPADATLDVIGDIVGMRMDIAFVAAPHAEAVALNAGLPRAVIGTGPAPGLDFARTADRQTPVRTGLPSPTEAPGDTAFRLPESGEESVPTAGFLARLKKRLQAETGSNSRIQLKLFANGDGFTVAVQGFGESDELRRQLERIARQIGNEFGVTVSDIFVSSTLPNLSVPKTGRRL